MRKEKSYLKCIDSRIRLFCHRLTRRQRNIVTATVFLLFLTASLYTVLASLSGLEEPDRSMKIEHIRSLDLRSEKSTNHLNNPIDENRHPKD